MKYFKKLIVFHFLIVFAFAEFEKDLQLKLILAEPGDTIKLDAGFFPILGHYPWRANKILLSKARELVVPY